MSGTFRSFLFIRERKMRFYTMRYEQIRQWLQDERNGLFDTELVSALIAAFPYEKTSRLADGQARQLLVGSLPHKITRRSDEEITALAVMFAHITDCKSHVTCPSLHWHCRKDARHICHGCDSETISKLYVGDIDKRFGVNSA